MNFLIATLDFNQWSIGGVRLLFIFESFQGGPVIVVNLTSFLVYQAMLTLAS